MIKKNFQIIQVIIWQRSTFIIIRSNMLNVALEQTNESLSYLENMLIHEIMNQQSKDCHSYQCHSIHSMILQFENKTLVSSENFGEKGCGNP